MAYAMDKEDQGVVDWLQNKLSGDGKWSSPEVAALLNDHRLAAAQRCFTTLEPQVRVRLLLSFVEMRRTERKRLAPALEGIIALAEDDGDDWVRTIAQIIKDFPQDGILHTDLSDSSKPFSDAIRDIEDCLSKQPAPVLQPMESPYLSPYLLKGLTRPPDEQHFKLRKKFTRLTPQTTTTAPERTAHRYSSIRRNTITADRSSGSSNYRKPEVRAFTIAPRPTTSTSDSQTTNIPKGMSRREFLNRRIHQQAPAQTVKSVDITELQSLAGPGRKRAGGGRGPGAKRARPQSDKDKQAADAAAASATPASAPTPMPADMLSSSAAVGAAYSATDSVPMAYSSASTGLSSSPTAQQSSPQSGVRHALSQALAEGGSTTAPRARAPIPIPTLDRPLHTQPPGQRPVSAAAPLPAAPGSMAATGGMYSAYSSTDTPDDGGFPTQSAAASLSSALGQAPPAAAASAAPPAGFVPSYEPPPTPPPPSNVVIQTEEEQNARIAANKKLQNVFAQANMVTLADRQRIMDFIEKKDTLPRDGSEEDVEAIVINEERSPLPDGTTLVNNILFEMTFSTESWRRVRRKKTVKTSR